MKNIETKAKGAFTLQFFDNFLNYRTTFKIIRKSGFM